MRRGIWINQDVSKGEEITRDKIDIVRPSHGISADELIMVLGKTASRDIQSGEPLEWAALF